MKLCSVQCYQQMMLITLNNVFTFQAIDAHAGNSAREHINQEIGTRVKNSIITVETLHRHSHQAASSYDILKADCCSYAHLKIAVLQQPPYPRF